MSKRQCAIDLFLTFETQRNTHFSAQLFRLIAKADMRHRFRLAISFPEEVAAYDEWYDAVNSWAFYEKYLTSAEMSMLRKGKVVK